MFATELAREPRTPLTAVVVKLAVQNFLRRRLIRRVICARLSPVILPMYRRNIPLRAALFPVLPLVQRCRQPVIHLPTVGHIIRSLVFSGMFFGTDRTLPLRYSRRLFYRALSFAM